MKRLIAAAALLLIIPAMALAQNADRPSRGQGYLFFGLGTNNGTQQHRLVKHVGFGGELFMSKHFGAGLELGYAHWGGVAAQAWIPSGDISYHFRKDAPRGKADPFLVGGITGYFPTSMGRGDVAGNFGGGVNIWLRRRLALRLEVRDICSDNNYLRTHYVSFRVGLTFR